MTASLQPQLTLQDFFALPQGKPYLELVEGQAIPKMSPQRFHSKAAGALYVMLFDWCQEQGEVGIEWAVVLKRREKDWVPIPDVLYVSYARLAMDIGEDGPCSVPPELVVEVVSPDQSFGEMAEKAMDYLYAGVLRVWVVDPRAQSITVFISDSLPITYRGATIIRDELLPGLAFSAQEFFQRAGLIAKS